MRYLQLVITTNKDKLEPAREALEIAGFDEMIINDPADILEIEEHPEWYKFDYINEELSDIGSRRPGITLYFSDDEEGRAEADRAVKALEGMAGEQEQMNAQEHTRPEKTGSAARLKGISWELSATSDDSEWLYKWQEHFKPTKVGSRIVVKPSWEEYDAKPDELVIEMDPGMAFGSGLHETTTLCIRALEEVLQAMLADGPADETDIQSLSPRSCGRPLVRPNEKSGCKVLDVGCGTGILSIAAALLGADECLGIDIDPDAVRVAGENVERNGLIGRIGIIEGDLMSTKAGLAEGDPVNIETPAEGSERQHVHARAYIEEKYDIIVANLMTDLVERLSPAAAQHLDEGGTYISSGILDARCDEVADAVRAAGFEIQEIAAEGEWRAIVARRQ